MGSETGRAWASTYLREGRPAYLRGWASIWRASAGQVRTLLALALGVVANAAVAADCGALCGVWQLDAAASDPVDVKVDAVLAEYREVEAA